MRVARARAVLLAGLVGASAVIVFEFPLGEILHQRSELAVSNAQLQSIESRNASLNADIHALSSDATITAIAHEEYGLIKPGQRSYVILPAAGSSGDVSRLATPALPPQDLVAAPPGDQSDSAVPASPGSGDQSFWSRFAAKLEFWRWAF